MFKFIGKILDTVVGKVISIVFGLVILAALVVLGLWLGGVIYNKDGVAVQLPWFDYIDDGNGNHFIDKDGDGIADDRKDIGDIIDDVEDVIDDLTISAKEIY